MKVLWFSYSPFLKQISVQPQTTLSGSIRSVHFATEYLAYLCGTKHIFLASETEKQAEILCAFHPHMVIFSSAV